MSRRLIRSTALVALVAMLATTLWVVLGPVGDAQAASRVTVENEFGKGEADTSYSTEITVSGSGFQSIQGAFGGVYVFFGTVGDGWQPSKGGQSGVDFRYVPDAETQNNAGFQRFVAFPGSSTADEAHATMSDSGGWTVTMTVPGPTFQTTGRSGGTETVDCRTTRCGIITIGAHGVKNPQNETFTPVAFADIYSGGSGPTDPPGGDEPGGETPGAEEPATDEAGTEGPDVAAPAEPTLDVDRATAVVGRVLTYTARGLVPGEQLTVSLGAGLAAAGPLVAGAHGEVAGVLQLPADLRAGTHSLVLTAAASGTRVEVEFQVAAAPAPPVAPSEPDDEVAGGIALEWILLGIAALALIVVVIVGLVTARRERRARHAAADQAPSSPGPDEVSPAPVASAGPAPEAPLEPAGRVGANPQVAR